MSNLSEILPDFNLGPFQHLLHSLQKNEITVADLLSLEPADVARKCPLPLLDIRHLANSVIEHLQRDLHMIAREPSTSSELLASTNGYQDAGSEAGGMPQLEEPKFISTGDPKLDCLLGGGLPTGYITEVVGESAVGKTQFLFGLLLAVQMPPPHGLGRSAIYFSTEDELNTKRLQQILDMHPVYKDVTSISKPTFDGIRSMTVSTLEAQQRVLEYQLPIAVERFGAGLVVVDSIAANFRTDHETGTTAGLAKRSEDLAKVGKLLRRLASEYNVAVVVANQVSDRFTEIVVPPRHDGHRASSPASSAAAPSQNGNNSGSVFGERSAKLTLDHQQRFFTGWGERAGARLEGLKTPALGVSWANQIDARIVLKVETEGRHAQMTTEGKKRRRFMSLVFAPWAAPSVKPIEYSIESYGITVAEKRLHSTENDEEILHEGLWDQDEEFP